ncbi:MAG TPA: hypothetical protein VG347_21470 [Verrucomicrobiae bacterium]|nr:hypothetical protein [Verrucomicrobiae bacterium]
MKASSLKFKITVDFSSTLKQMITAGRYDWKNTQITSRRFPIVGTGKQTSVVKLVHFNRPINSGDNVKVKLEALGLKASTIEELLAFGIAFSDYQCRFPVVALGSIVKLNGLHFVAYLSYLDLHRKIDLQLYDKSWGGQCRFLTSPK